MKERIERLKRRAIQFDEPQQRQFFIELAELISDLIHKVEEFEPEQITMEEVNKYFDEEDRDLLHRSTQAQNRLQQGIERDKLAKDLVDLILEGKGYYPPSIRSVATELKEKLDAPRK